MFTSATEIVTVTLNPAIDRLIEVKNFEAGKHLTGRRLDVYPAGKGIRVSRVLAQLGTRSIATGFVGTDELEMFEAYLNEKATVRAVPQLLRVNGPTRENVTIVDPVMDQSTYVRESGFELTEKDLGRMESKIGLMAREDTILCFCGSIPPGLSTDQFRTLVSRSIDAGASVMVDTVGEALKAVLDLPLWLLRMNRTTAAKLTGKPVKTRDQAHEVAKQLCDSAQVTAVTAGSEGAALCVNGRGWTGHCGLHPGLVVNSVGSGECFVAGLLHSWRLNGDWSAAFAHAIAVGTVHTMTVRAGDVDLDLLPEWTQHVKIEAHD